MPDPHQHLRELPFTALASALGLDMQRFKRNKSKAGMNWQGLCPVHKGKDGNSFSYCDSGVFNCFNCGAKGKGLIDLTMQIRQCTFTDAVAFLQVIQPINSHGAQKNAPEGISDASGAIGELKPYTGSYEKFKANCAWLNARVPDKAIQERFGVFQYVNNSRKSAYNGRVLIPFKDSAGTVWGYMGRAIEGEPKYLIPGGFPKSRFLFGAHELTHPDTPHKGHLPVKVLYVVESAFCVLKFAQYNLPAVSPFGWSVSEEQLDILGKLCRGLVYLPDANKYRECGNVASAIAARLWLRFPLLPDGIDDPEELSREEILAL